MYTTIRLGMSGHIGPYNGNCTHAIAKINQIALDFSILKSQAQPCVTSVCLQRDRTEGRS